ncbi:ATP-binding cassette domain-containing protein [Celerinatantimonas yamalensis]|uniref:ATP-binding cassette domain-containing protein n=1 Tax=Celerinatantimonas yamalensis TaxID=559956 RepID=A0ABW9G7R0_9GAMM
MTNLAVSATDLSLSLGHRQLFHCEHLAIEQGAFVGLLGGNGVGKTTFLRMLLGLQKAHYHHLDVLGKPCNEGNAAVSYLPQLKAHSSRLALCADSLFQCWRPRHVSRKQWQQRIDYAIDQVNGLSLAKQAMDTLSGGEYQRLMLAQALLNEPKLLLLDEPLVGLDPNRQYRLVELISHFQQDLGVTVICSTHELNPFINHFTSVLLIHEQLLRQGKATELLTSDTLSELYHCHLHVITHHGRQHLIAHPDSDLYV